VWNYSTNSYGTFAATFEVYSSPAVSNGNVYIGSDEGSVYCLNATGAVVWNFYTGDWTYSSPAVAGGNVYVSCWDHNFYCLNASTGAVVWNYTTGSNDDSSPAVSGSYVYMGSVNGVVYAFGGGAVPEFPPTMILPLFTVISTLAAAVAIRRAPRKTKSQN